MANTQKPDKVVSPVNSAVADVEVPVHRRINYLVKGPPCSKFFLYLGHT